MEQEKKRSLVEGQPGAPPALPPQQQQPVQPAASQPLPTVSEMPPPSHYPTPQQQNHNGSHRTSVTSGTSSMQQCKHNSGLKTVKYEPTLTIFFVDPLRRLPESEPDEHDKQCRGRVRSTLWRGTPQRTELHLFLVFSATLYRRTFQSHPANLCQQSGMNDIRFYFRRDILSGTTSFSQQNLIFGIP